MKIKYREQMKKYNIILLLFISVISFTACEDFLDEKSESGFLAETLFETPEGLEKMVVAFYPYERGIVTWGNANGYLAGHIWGERTTDLSIFTTGEDANLCRYTSPGPTSNISTIIYTPFWRHRYAIIGRANEIIYYGSKLGEEAENSIAEASFWRAYAYYNLWSRFSTLYINTEPTTSENLGNLNYVPADSVDVFKLMYEDLERAIDVLPLERTEPNEGRVTKTAARHLKALIAAWASDWDEVALQVDKIEEEGSRSLINDPAQIFNRSDYYNLSEAIFTLHFSNERGGGSGHRVGSQYVNVISESAYTHQLQDGVLVAYNESNLGRQWGLAFPNSYLISLYPENDKRMQAYYKTHYTFQNPRLLTSLSVPPAQLLTENGIDYYSTFNMTGETKKVEVGDTIYGRDLKAAGRALLDRRNLLPSSLKMVDLWSKPIDTDNGSASYKDIMVYRLAETYLLGAEAYIKKSAPDQQKARYYYNKTWTRAGHSEETGNITFDMIRDEHARELAFEGRRWDFLKRNGIWYSQMIKYAGDFTKYPGSTVDYNPGTYGISDGRDKKFGPDPNYYKDFNGADNDILVRFNVKPFHVRWPIPQTQIDAMGPSFPQNEGY